LVVSAPAAGRFLMRSSTAVLSALSHVMTQPEPGIFLSTLLRFVQHHSPGLPLYGICVGPSWRIRPESSMALSSLATATFWRSERVDVCSIPQAARVDTNDTVVPK